MTQGKQIQVFASEPDWRLLLDELDPEQTLRCVLAGLSDSSEFDVLSPKEALQRSASVEVDDSNQAPMFLLAEEGIEFELRQVPQRGGGVKYAMDLLTNESAIVIRFGSANSADRFMISGCVGSLSKSRDNDEIFGRIKGAIARRFTIVGSAYLSPDAMRFLDSGWRLCWSVRQPRMYDLARN